MSQYLPHFPTGRIRILFVETELQLRSLSDTVAPNAARHPGQPAPSGIVADARRVLDAIARIVAREKSWRGQLLLVEAPNWAELGAKLALAAAALRRFSALYLDPPDPDEEEDDDEANRLPPLAPPPGFMDRMLGRLRSPAPDEARTAEPIVPSARETARGSDGPPARQD